jgi:hypothetical protein
MARTNYIFSFTNSSIGWIARPIPNLPSQRPYDQDLPLESRESEQA